MIPQQKVDTCLILKTKTIAYLGFFKEIFEC